MAAIRQEREEVFETSHAKILELLARGRARRACASITPTAWRTRAATSSGCVTRGAERVWVEKILRPARPREALRDWPVCGTVGYEFLNDACALFVDPSAREPLTELLRGGHGRVALVRRDRSRGPARAGPRTLRSASSPGSSACGPFGAHGARPGPGGAAGLPDLRRALERARRGRPTARRSRPPG